MINHKIVKALTVVFLVSLLAMLWLYSKGYENSIGWEVTTTAEVVEYPAINVDGQLMDFQVEGEKYLLTENYSGGPITRDKTSEQIFLCIAWLGIGIVLVSASFLKRFGFMLVLALFVLFINRLNLVEVGLFGSNNQLIVGGLPFALLVGPLFIFHEYLPKVGFLARLITFVLLSTFLVLVGIDQHTIFLDHFLSHTTFTFGLAGILFLFAISEENVFAILFLITKGKGGKSNHLHFILLSLIYLVNLILYYLNKSGYVPNSFSFFDPFILLTLSSVVAIWSLKFKIGYLSRYLPGYTLTGLVMGLGIVFLSFLNLSFLKGVDSIYESFHYFILYFHIGFGVFFFLYIIINFIDPLVQGLEVYKIVYKEQHFPYVSARLGGLVVVLGFYFLSTQEAYDLLRSGYYVNLGSKEEALKNPNVANQYYQQAAFLGYNTHYPNYRLAWLYSDNGNEYLTQTHFEKASSRFPSPFAYVNYAMLNEETNSVQARAALQRAIEQFGKGEIINNIGVMRFNRNDWKEALTHFENAESSNTWNQAPLLNKWAALYKLNATDSLFSIADYENGNFGVRANLLLSNADSIPFKLSNLMSSPPLHRQAYLLNAAPVFQLDTLDSLIHREVSTSINASLNDRLRKTLAIYYYKKGNVNAAFRMLDYLQANTYDNGAHLNDLGILALDQGAYQLALDFFEKALEAKHQQAAINRLEALAGVGRSDEIADALIQIVQQDPGLTVFANQILANVPDADFNKSSTRPIVNLESLSDEALVDIANQNAFDEALIIRSVDILNARGISEAYDIILEATEINPYSHRLLMAYALTAAKQNLIDYAENVLSKIEELSTPTAFSAFMAEYEQVIQQAVDDTW